MLYVQVFDRTFHLYLYFNDVHYTCPPSIYGVVNKVLTVVSQALDVIMVKDEVVATTSFHNLKDKSKPGVEKGMRGIVESIDEDGDYWVKWQPMSDTRAAFYNWAFRSKKQIRRLSDQEVQFICISRGSHNVCSYACVFDRSCRTFCS